MPTQGTVTHDGDHDPARIVYTAASANVIVTRKSASVRYEFNMNKKPDHLPVLLQVKCHTTSLTGGWERRKSVYDQTAVNDLVRVDTLRKHSQEAPIVHYMTEPTSRLHVINEHMTSGLANAFGKPKPVNRQSYISGVTFQHVRERGALGHEASRLGRSIGRSCALFCFMFWAKHV